MSLDLEHGFERDRLDEHGLVIRWWLFVHVDGEDGRPQEPRRGVSDDGFLFARGGRAATDDDAREALEQAAREAQAEYGFWRGQPSHALGALGDLIPLGHTELPA